jgi:hypothetical protein
MSGAAMTGFDGLLPIEMCTPAKAGAQNSNANLALFRTGPRLSPECTKG